MMPPGQTEMRPRYLQDSTKRAQDAPKSFQDPPSPTQTMIFDDLVDDIRYVFQFIGRALEASEDGMPQIVVPLLAFWVGATALYGPKTRTGPSKL